ncbi:MAG: hypothetical protein EA381_04080 [Planctomycetaceae bacterium]|nr:MAG: hypothetical protein EA381_04080 [Planctomycetaceae bacterium]
MKGIVFTEFIQFIESEFGMVIADHLLVATNPKSGGAYTAVGSYDAGELLAMVVELAKVKQAPVPVLVKAFGNYLFFRFFETHGPWLAAYKTTEQLLGAIENHIHVEVRKLYPDAELPHLTFRQVDTMTSELRYQSIRPLADLAEGLIESTIRHFGDPITFVRVDLPPADGTSACFRLTRTSS